MSILGVRFYPTEVELINILKRFLKGKLFQCPIKLVEIYGDQPPWAFFTAEEKVDYFITPTRKQKGSEGRHYRTCANGTWRGQTSAKPIKNHKGSVVGFRRNYKYQCHSKEEKKNNGKDAINWLMREYFVGDDFFTENNIPKQDFTVCRIKKYIKQKKDNDKAIVDDMEEDVVKGIIEGMLHGPDACATTFMNGEYDLRGYNQINDQVLRNSTMVKQNTTGESSTLKEDCQIQQVQGNVANEIIGSSDFWEMINGILKYVTVNIPDDPLQVDDQPALELLVNENIFNPFV